MPESSEGTGVRSTFFVPGAVAEQYPDKVAQIVADGHEIGYHGYRHESEIGYPIEKEIENMDKSEKILEKIYGKKIVGHRGCNNIIQPYTMDLIRSRGYKYSSVMKDRDWAYISCKGRRGSAGGTSYGAHAGRHDIFLFYIQPDNK